MLIIRSFVSLGRPQLEMTEDSDIYEDHWILFVSVGQDQEARLAVS